MSEKGRSPQRGASSTSYSVQKRKCHQVLTLNGTLHPPGVPPLRQTSQTREPDADIRKLLLEALIQLCAKKVHRELMREQKVYFGE